MNSIKNNPLPNQVYSKEFKIFKIFHANNHGNFIPFLTRNHYHYYFNCCFNFNLLKRFLQRLNILRVTSDVLDNLSNDNIYKNLFEGINVDKIDLYKEKFYMLPLTEFDIGKIDLNSQMIICDFESRNLINNYVNEKISNENLDVFHSNYRIVDFLYSGFGPQLNPNLFSALGYICLHRRYRERQSY